MNENELASVREHVVVALAPVQPLIILVGGSVAEGLGTPRSDIDVICVMPAGSERGRAVNTRVGGCKCEILPVPEELFLERLHVVDFAGWSLDQLDAIRRLVTGLPVLGQDRYARLMQEFNAPQFRRAVRDYYLRRAASHYDDVLGLFEAGRLDESCAAARSYLEHACDAALVAAGDLYFRAKWRIARVRRTFPRHAALRGIAQDLSRMLAGMPSSELGEKGLVRLACRCALWLCCTAQNERLLEIPGPGWPDLAGGSGAVTALGCFPARNGAALRTQASLHAVSTPLASAITLRYVLADAQSVALCEATYPALVQQADEYLRRIER